MNDRQQPPHVRAWRAVLNEHWPDRLREIRNRNLPIPVRARVVFVEDGETWLDGAALRWNADHVYIEVNDRRLNASGVWLKPRDVYRLAQDQTDSCPDHPREPR